MKRLAISGGEASVKYPKPHYTWPIIGQDEINAVVKQLTSSEISIYGRSGIIQEFEDEFSGYLGRRYALSTSSGTCALLSAFFGCGIGPGDEVIAPTYTFLATVTPIFHVNAYPVLVDCDINNGNIDPNDISKRITNKTKAIVINHNWGHPCDMDEITKIARHHDLLIIEDCSHAHGATYKGKKVGCFGDVACFSLQGNKLVSAGEGGILVTDNQEIYERATLFGHYNVRSKQCVENNFYKQFADTGYGLKFRIHPLAASLALAGFKKMDKLIESRKDALAYFSDCLSNTTCITPPITYPDVTRGAYYGYKPFYNLQHHIRINTFVKALVAEGVDVSIPSSKPLHLLPLFQIRENGMYKGTVNNYVYTEGDFPNAESYYNRLLSFPTFTFYSQRSIIDQYIEAITKVEKNIEELVAFEKSPFC